MKRVQVTFSNNKTFSYETDLKNLRVGTRVLVPAPWWARYDNNTTMEGKIASLTSDYTGDCIKIISKSPKKISEKK